MDAMQNLLTRRSVRKYLDKAVPKEKIQKVIEAGLYAANGMGGQSPIIVAVTDKKTRDKISEANAKIMGTSADPFYGAPVILIVLAPPSVATHVYDGSCVMQNLMLAAHEEGLGSCWIHRAKEEFETPEWKDWLKSLGAEGEWEGIGHCALGYADCNETQPAPRKANRVFWAE